MEGCEVCEILARGSEALLFDGKFWTVALNPNQEYLGRIFVTLKEHKPALKELSQEEWVEFNELVARVESSIDIKFSPTHFNWQCLMNEAISKKQPTHVHWHCIPRYTDEKEFNGLVHKDPTWPAKYQNVDPKYMSPEGLSAIRDYLNN